jgi:hypothetical protein
VFFSFPPQVINVLHCVTEKAIDALAVICSGAKKVAIYGPFKRFGRFTTESNERFHEKIHAANADFGLRDIDSRLIPAFEKNGLVIERITDMPQNNFFVVFKKQ